MANFAPKLFGNNDILKDEKKKLFQQEIPTFDKIYYFSEFSYDLVAKSVTIIIKIFNSCYFTLIPFTAFL